jgi:hypothetical protein
MFRQYSVLDSTRHIFIDNKINYLL